MSKTLKWILGTLAALVIIAVAAAAVYVAWNHAPLSLAYRQNRNLTAPGATPGPSQTQPYGQPNQPYGQTQPNQPFGFRQYRGYPDNGFGRHMPMMGGRGFFNFGMMPFGFGLFFLGGLVRLLIPIVILVLVAILFYQLGRHSRPAPAPVAPSSPPPTAPSEPPTPPAGRKVAKS